MSEAVRMMVEDESILGAPAERPVLVKPKPRAWIVVVSRPSQEFIAKQQLEDQARKGKLGEGFEVYLPLRLYEDSKKVTCPRPFLPNYLFARVTTHMADWRGVFSTRGVKGVLGVGGARALGLKDSVVDRIRLQEEAGFVRLGLLPDDVHKSFDKGQKVKVDDLVEALFMERVDARRGLILYSFFRGHDSQQVVDLRRLSESS